MNACANVGKEFWNINGGMKDMGEHMGEWEWLYESNKFPKQSKNYSKQTLAPQRSQNT